MKKILAIILAAVMVCSLAACGNTTPETPSVENTVPADKDNVAGETAPTLKDDETSDNDTQHKLPEDNTFHAFVVNVGYADAEEIVKYAHPSSVLPTGDINYPVFIVKSRTDLELFIERYKDVLNLGTEEDKGSFVNLTSIYTNEFFETNSLMLAYIASSSGSITYKVDSMELNSTHMNMNIVAEIPEIGTDDMAGHLAVARLYNDIIQACDTFTASRVIEEN